MQLANYKPFLIQIGAPGAWSNNLFQTKVSNVSNVPGEYTQIDTMSYGAVVKHMPFSLMKKMKDVVVQTWKDEEGDDVWLPKDANGNPVVFHEAVEFTVDFVFHEKLADANHSLRELVKAIEGRWLRVFDYYTGIGFDGVYLSDVDDDPKFKRRDHTTVIFTLTFKANGNSNDTPFT